MNEERLTEVPFIPSITTLKGMTQVLFRLDLHKCDDDVEGMIAEFVEKTHEAYYKAYTHQQDVSRAVRRVDPDEVAAVVLYELERHKELPGRVAFNVIFVVENLDDEVINLATEYVQFQLHWHAAENIGNGKSDKVLPIFPMGFQVFTNHQYESGVMMSSVAFDLRVMNKQVESSSEYYLEEVLPGMDAYLQKLENIYKVCKKELSFSFQDVRAALAGSIKEIYEFRLNNPDSPERVLLFLKTLFKGHDPETAQIIVHITADVEETETPELPRTDSTYKATGTKNGHILHSWHSR